MRKFYMAADFTDRDGVDKFEVATCFETGAPMTELDAIQQYFNTLEAQGKDVHAITIAMNGINSAAEMMEMAEHGPKPGVVYYMMVYDLEEGAG